MRKESILVRLERFLDKVVVGADPYNDCWTWIGSLDKAGYSKFGNAYRYEQRAYRWAYKAFVDRLPKDYTIDHLCRNRACVNPVHLEAVTQGENNRRGNGVAGVNSRKQVCKAGHPLTGPSTRPEKNKYGSSRRCKICKAAYDKKRLASLA